MNRTTTFMRIPDLVSHVRGTIGWLAVAMALPFHGLAQTIDPYYAASYNTLLIGAEANTDAAKIYSITVVRGANGHITGFSGSATYFADAAGLPLSGGGIDGGLIYGPGNVLFYASYSDNSIGQIKPGQSTVAKQTDLGTINVEGSTGSLVIVPPGMPGAGRLKILSYKASKWYDTTLSPDGSGTYNFAPVSGSVQFDLSMGLEGAFYVAAGNPKFPNPSVLVCDYGASRIVSCEVDGNGDPLPNTQRDFATDLSGVEGAAVDPLTGDFVFSTFTGAEVYVVGGFGVAKPTVAITAPANNATFIAPASFSIYADAAQTGGAISKVDFYLDAVLVGTANTAPYNADVRNVGAGNHALTAVAVGNGLSTTSAVVHVIVTSVPPNVAVRTPGDNSIYNECAEVQVTATADAPGGSVTNVAYYLSTTGWLASRTQSPYLLLASLPVGTNYLTAVATDNIGASATSAVVRVVFKATPTNTMSANLLVSGELRLCFRGLIT
ncbi:MAG: Ig-like domain-containing protein, partial [Verrucomicrobia bacterium]|nr:Ig-like domain-containing protein [Verrucomicrobiota bacterium]